MLVWVRKEAAIGGLRMRDHMQQVDGIACRSTEDLVLSLIEFWQIMWGSR